MVRYSFDYSTIPINITFLKKIDNKVADTIHNFITHYKNELNHNIYNSSAYFFNETKPNSPTVTSKEFLYFLELNLKNAFENINFNPFIARTNKFLAPNLSELIKIDKQNLSFIKTGEISFDTNVLRTSFILDSLFELLIRNKIYNFLINHGDLYRSNGKGNWKVEYNLEDNSGYIFPLNNTSASLNLNDSENFNQEYNFLSLDKLIKHKFVIVENLKGFIDNTIHAHNVKKIVMESELKDYGKNNKVNLVLLTHSGDLLEFKGI